MSNGNELLIAVPGTLIHFALICWVIGTAISWVLSWLQTREERRLAEAMKETFK